MGCSTFLVSDEKREWCDLGKVYWDEAFLGALNAERQSFEALEVLIRNHEYLAEDGTTDRAEAADFARRAVAWMVTHPDWRYMTEYDDEFDDVYLAEDQEDVTDYVAEFGMSGDPLYMKTGSAWDEDKNEEDDDGDA